VSEYLNAEMMEGFVKKFLLDTYSEPCPIPAVHREWWQLVTSQDRFIAIAAPRSHAKSTAINHAYGLAASLFRQNPFQLKVSRTYQLAVEKLRQAKEELAANEKIKHVFGFNRFIRDTENDFIAEMKDGYQFRMSAIGMEQAIRGLSWGTHRPSLINGDDMEDDEQVLNPNTREKSWNWVMNTLLPMGSDNCLYRIYGTILHRNAVLSRLIRMKGWTSRVYQACDAAVSEESILWPQKFPRERLLELRQMYIDGGNLVGFNMEYRNIAQDDESGFFQRSDFVELTDEERKEPHTVYCGADFAISTQKKNNRSVFAVAGLSPHNYLDLLEIRKGHWDSKRIVDEMIDVQRTYGVDTWFVEDGQIWKSIKITLEDRMREEGVFLNIHPCYPQADKMTRAQPIRARMRARGCRIDKSASWYPEFEQNLISFRGSKGDEDDDLDAWAWVGQGLTRMVQPLTRDEQEEEDWETEKRESTQFSYGGRSLITGY